VIAEKGRDGKRARACPRKKNKREEETALDMGTKKEGVGQIGKTRGRGGKRRELKEPRRLGAERHGDGMAERRAR